MSRAFELAFEIKISHASSTNNTLTSFLMDATRHMRFILKSLLNVFPLKRECHSGKVGEQAREENSGEDAGNQHRGGHHSCCDLILWIILGSGRVHHGQ